MPPGRRRAVPAPSIAFWSCRQSEAAARTRKSSASPRALALVSGQNPQIAFANEQINEAFAQLRGAKVLWLPSIQAGINYQNHDGPLQNNDGTITVASRSALEAGLGMYAVGGGAPAIPGLSAKFALADAVFQPRIAGQQVAARQHAATATTHDFLLFVAVAYLDLLRAFQQQAIARETLDHAEQLAELTAAFARSGQGSQADADRAQTELAVRKNVLAQAAVQTQVASARLVELLNLPPEPRPGAARNRPSCRSSWFRTTRRRPNWSPTACRTARSWPRAATLSPKRSGDWIASGTRRSCPACSWM